MSLESRTPETRCRCDYGSNSARETGIPYCFNRRDVSLTNETNRGKPQKPRECHSGFLRSLTLLHHLLKQVLRNRSRAVDPVCLTSVQNRPRG